MKARPTVAVALRAAAFALTVASAATAQTAQEGDSSQKYGQEFKGKIGRTYAESQEWYPEPTKAKPGTPNVLIILLDDVGSSQIGSYGGLVQTRAIDALAADGLRYLSRRRPCARLREPRCWRPAMRTESASVRTR